MNLLFDGDKLDDVFVFQFRHHFELPLPSNLLALTDVTSKHLACHQVAATLHKQVIRMHSGSSYLRRASIG